MEGGQSKFTQQQTISSTKTAIIRKRLARNEDLKKKYNKTVIQYIDNNHATKIPPEDLTPEKASTTPIINYIPHHAVMNQYKPDKVCVVYDAVAKYRNCS